MNDQQKIRTIKTSGTGMPEICCPECVTATLDENFTCPACLYYMSRQARLDYDIFWDSSRSCWYRPRLTPAEGWFWGACVTSCYSWVDAVLPQACVGPYRADFLLADAMVVIEIDGFSNHSNALDITRDRRRQRWLQAQGYRVIRFSNTEVLQAPRQCAAEADALIRGGLR